MAETIQKHFWADIGNAPEASGVYAWYYSPEITDFDVDSTIKAVRSAPERTEAERAIRSVLDSRLFHHFREEPYTVAISGPLKPAYTGALEQESAASASWVSRLASEPERLPTIREVLAKSAPMFTSPLYIGMAAVLRARLAHHKKRVRLQRPWNSLA